MTKITSERAALQRPWMIKRTKHGYFLLDGKMVREKKERRKIASKDTCSPCRCQTCQNRACRRLHGNPCIGCIYPPVRGCHEHERGM